MRHSATGEFLRSIHWIAWLALAALLASFLIF